MATHAFPCNDAGMTLDPVCDKDYETLARFRYELRRFLRFSEDAAAEAGLTPQQHQALLAVRAEEGGEMLVGTLADRLLLKPHSTTELVNRLEKLGLVERRQLEDDRRKVCVAITRHGRGVLGSLSASHRAEIRRMQPMLEGLIDRM
jgi:DNA-binding MarR family transcriptional regulator